MTWYTFAILAAFVWGIQNFLYKVSAEYKCNSAWTTLTFCFTSATLAVIFLVFGNEPISNVWFLFAFSFIAALTYVSNDILKIEALKHVATSVMFPIARMNTAIIAVIGIAFLMERPSLYQVIGIVLSIVVIFLVAKQHKQEDVPERNFKLGVTLSVIALFVATAGTLVTKYGAVWLNNFAFIAVANSYNVFMAMGLRKKLQTKLVRTDHTHSIVIGIAIGLLHFLGLSLLLRAFELGPMSIVQSIKGMSFVVAVILGAIVYKEKLTSRRVLGVALTIVALILLKS